MPQALRRRLVKKLSAAVLALGLAGLPAECASAYRVDGYDDAPMTNLAQADAAIAAGAPTASVFESVIEFDDLGDGTRGSFSINNPWPVSPPDTFAAHVRGNFMLGSAGTWTFSINHHDGARIVIDGVPVATADGVADNLITSITANFAAGLHTVDIVYFENGGGASLEFLGRFGNGANALIQSIPEPGTLALPGLSLVGLGCRRRNSA